jgi:hypothetical protein
MTGTVPRPPRGSKDTAQRARETGALYVHLQSESGTEHRTFVVPPARARLLRTLWSRWGLALVLAIGGSWVYFAVQSSRIPMLTRRLSELEAEALRMDTLQARLQALKAQYDQVQRMLGIPRAESVRVNTAVPESARRK